MSIGFRTQLRGFSWLAVVVLMLSLGPVDYAHSNDFPRCLDLTLGRLLARHLTPSAEPEFLNRMSLDNPDWLLETVRMPIDAKVERAHMDSGFANYLAKVQLATRVFDKQFRSGTFSSRIREGLREQHVAQVTGGDEAKLYAGTVGDPGKNRYKLNRDTVGKFVYETLRPDETTPPPTEGLQLPLVVTQADPMRDGGEWTGPGRKGTPPPFLDGPFPANNGEVWELWIPEIAAKAAKKGYNPKRVLPRQVRKLTGVFHEYPVFWRVYTDLYVERMSELMSQIEDHLLRHPNDNTPSTEVLGLIAEYYQVAINVHFFPGVNNSILMNQVNYLLHYMGYRGISHGALDYYALYKLPPDFKRIFLNAVAERNPGMGH